MKTNQPQQPDNHDFEKYLGEVPQTHCDHCHGRVGAGGWSIGDGCGWCTPEDPDDEWPRSELGEYLFDLGATLARVEGEGEV